MSFSFLSDEFSSAVDKVLELYVSVKDDATLDEWSKSLVKNLAFVNVLPHADRREFEEYCLLAKKYNGFNLASIFKYELSTGEKLERFNLCMYVYYKEVNFRQGVTAEGMLQLFFNFIENNKLNFQPNLNYFFTFVDQISYFIMSEIYSNPNFQKISQTIKEPKFEEYLESFNKIDSFISKITHWEATFQAKETAVTQLESRLESSKKTYDFVLLNKGFKELYEQKKAELKERRNGYSSFGATLAITPLLLIIFSFIGFWLKGEEILKYLLYVMFPVSTFMLIILYFVRVSLQHVRSVQSQMMQLELRMALCQFIHNYADDSEKLHKKNAAGFEKFENIIFSPLVSSDDKIPTTFDGMEQLAKLVSEFRR